MKKIDITSEFISNKIKENFYVETPKYWSDCFKENLRVLIESDDDDFDENCYKDVKEDIESDCLMDYETYCNHYEYICGIADTEVQKTYGRYERELQEIKFYSKQYVDVIETFPDVDYDVIFSKRSYSIYLIAKMSLTEENVSMFLNAKHCSIENVYDFDYIDDYPKDIIKIRISDHDFGGNEWLSYREDCVNIIV